MHSIMTRRGVLAATAALSAASCASAPAARTDDALGGDDAVGVAARVRNGEITPQEAIDAAIARAERVNPQLNFIATPAFDFARARAVAAPQGPLGGVPTLIKDLMPLAGVKTMYGSRAYADNVSDRQPPYVDAILGGGLVPIGKSTTPEFGYTATTEPLLTGATRNPWNPAYSCGGSSGGSGAAVAAGVVPIADASDGGGSIRIPASCNGLVGLKPSRRRHLAASLGEEPPPVEISVVGCVSRTVRDTAAWLALTERTGGNREYDPVGLVRGPNTRRLRIGVAIADFYGRDPDPQVRAAIEAAAELCRGLGHDVGAFTPEFDGAGFTNAFTLYWASGAALTNAAIREQFPDRAIEDLVEPLSLALEQTYNAAPEGAIGDAIAFLRSVEPLYESWFADMDVMLTPVLAKPPARIGAFAPTNPQAFQRIGEYVAYTPLQNASGAPAISLPLAWSVDDLPIGAHFSAKRGDERTLLELAYELEEAQPWRDRRPPVWAG
ncbi:MAG: amidase [Alphaproteobacteria bacterium]|nr:amidase [Alphaproteobacteria bacterium]